MSGKLFNLRLRAELENLDISRSRQENSSSIHTSASDKKGRETASEHPNEYNFFVGQNVLQDKNLYGEFVL